MPCLPPSSFISGRSLLLACALLAGCGEREASAPDRATAATVPQAAAAPVPPPAAPPLADPIAAAAAIYAESLPPLEVVDGVDQTMPPRYFNIDDCSEVEGEPDPGGREPAVEKVARRVAYLRRSLRLAGYPDELIEPPLARYTAAAAQMSDAAAYEALKMLATDLEAARVRLRPDLLPIYAYGECGAAEAPVMLRTRPAGGRVWLITKFAFDLCSAQRLDPWNRDACARWTEADPDRPLQLSGNYKVQARWADGGALRADRRIDTSDTDDAETPQLITLAHP